MSESLSDRIGSLWDRLRRGASDAVAQPGAALVRGKTVATDVLDSRGVLIAAAGTKVDDTVIKYALEAGAMPALLASVVTAATQDIKERVQTEFERTPEGQDRRNLANSELYIEARGYIKWVAALEVTDIRGTVLVPAGKVIEDEDVRLVREADQLAALIYSAQQSGPPPSAVTPSSEQVSRAEVIRPPVRRTATPLGGDETE